MQASGRPAAFCAERSLAAAGAIASAGRGALILSRGGAGRFWRGRALILAHAAIADAGEEQDLCAAVGGSRTTIMVRRLKADEVSHNSALVGIDGSIGSESFEAQWLMLCQRDRPTAIRLARALCQFALSKWVPGRLLGELEVAHVHSEAHSEAGSNWDHHNVPGVQRREA
jgi:hypothetical protein